MRLMGVMPMLATVDGSGLVRNLLIILVIGICCLIIWGVGRYFIKAFGAPPMAMLAWNGLFVLVGLFFIINFLLGLIGYPLIKW